MSRTQMGLLIGVLLGLAAAVGGFGAFAATVVFGAAGLLVGRYLDGKLDLSQFAGRDRG
ncbi:hypothetical protein [Lentzea guizhouensis]|uniref:hypothetical protein n=1 Tax=Lentzea guizhouensis TaxID=1586287 RepID=UPI0014767103|nr:hypothetical protein [Lentzea guizhouensis]